MICKYCKKDREYGYRIADVFLCSECSDEPFYQLALNGLGEAIDTSIEMDTATIDGEIIDISAPSTTDSETSFDSETSSDEPADIPN